ncbi:ATP-binding protein [Actinotignum timonense]|uniref:AlbA family DNA-binding domain-containing protein n=1 Tax=Actinotignum timonense TaxID=1870995 RepID=UPI00254BA9F4|nr:ATP-binding protein [Actinotignum timonense]MDK6907219.1 ATP-binding protein [Actinotignum timonense]
MRIPTTSEETGRLIEGFRQQGRDSQHIEVKAAAHGLPKSIVETLSAFSNGSGGLIVLGLDEARGFTPVPKFPAARIYDALAGVCSDSLTPPVRADIAMVPYGDTADGDTTLVMAAIPPLQPRDKPCYVTTRNVYGGSYIRTAMGTANFPPTKLIASWKTKHNPTGIPTWLKRPASIPLTQTSSTRFWNANASTIRVFSGNSRMKPRWSSCALSAPARMGSVIPPWLACSA